MLSFLVFLTHCQSLFVRVLKGILSRMKIATPPPREFRSFLTIEYPGKVISASVTFRTQPSFGNCEDIQIIVFEGKSNGIHLVRNASDVEMGNFKASDCR